jgi:hypothetical protein
MLMSRRRKMFFSEEKNQKTFISSAVVARLDKFQQTAEGIGRKFDLEERR